MQVGSLRDKNVTFGPFPCVKTLHVLGIDISYDNEVYTSFFKRTIEKIKFHLILWKLRGLSIVGKIQIVKTYAISQFMYAVSMLPMPEGVLKEINTLIFPFVWDGPDRVRREVLIKQI